MTINVDTATTPQRLQHEAEAAARSGNLRAHKYESPDAPYMPSHSGMSLGRGIQGLARARISRIFFSNLGEGRFHRKFYAIWARFRLSNDQRQLREISHFLIPSWPTSSSRCVSPTQAPEPQPAARHPRGRRRAAAAADCCPPRRRSHPCRLYRRAPCVPPLKIAQSCNFRVSFQGFRSSRSVEFLCNYHAIWAQKIEIMQ